MFDVGHHFLGGTKLEHEVEIGFGKHGHARGGGGAFLVGRESSPGTELASVATNCTGVCVQLPDAEEGAPLSKHGRWWQEQRASTTAGLPAPMLAGLAPRW